METRGRAWMVVSVLSGTLLACGKINQEVPTFHVGGAAEQILQEVEDSAKQIRTVIESARRGTPEAQHQLGMMILDKIHEYGEEERAEAVLEARAWLSRAAEQGHDRAQLQLGILYSEEYPPDYSFLTDYVMAYTWLTVALDKGASAPTNGQLADGALQKKMTAEQVAVAQKLAGELQKHIESSTSHQ